MFEKTPHFLTVKGFYSHFRHFAFATIPKVGHGVSAAEKRRPSLMSC